MEPQELPSVVAPRGWPVACCHGWGGSRESSRSAGELLEARRFSTLVAFVERALEHDPALRSAPGASRSGSGRAASRGRCAGGSARHPPPRSAVRIPRISPARRDRGSSRQERLSAAIFFRKSTPDRFQARIERPAVVARDRRSHSSTSRGVDQALRLPPPRLVVFRERPNRTPRPRFLARGTTPPGMKSRRNPCRRSVRARVASEDPPRTDADSGDPGAGAPARDDAGAGVRASPGFGDLSRHRRRHPDALNACVRRRPISDRRASSSRRRS